jgi:ABC-type multidrug transport system permease subunit
MPRELVKSRCTGWLAKRCRKNNNNQNAMLFASPLTASDYILGYSLPLLTIALIQSVVFFIVAFFIY